MSYQVIARKWRPQVFKDLVGQGHITQTLMNALRNKRLHHTLIFTGPRGTGKTSSARILAKALRCTQSEDFTPCGECVSCSEIAQNLSPDVREIDAASNNGVDAIRELRETVGYMPSSGKYKVYIIDEVHMLSTSAFNALLKTLEEPPENVIFILATTEIHKIPQTILSRSQRFDFRRISTRLIADHLKQICLSENIQAQDEALWMIARQGDGSMRDSQSLLDQVITFTNGTLDKNTLTQILGLTDRGLLTESLGILIQRDSAAAIRFIEKLNQSGFEPPLFTQELLESLRHLLFIKLSSENLQQIIELPDSEIQNLKEYADQVSESDIHILFDMALKLSTDLHKSLDPRLIFEVGFMRMSSAPKLKDLQSLLRMGSFPSISEEEKKKSLIQTEEYTKPQSPTSEIIQCENAQEKWMIFVEKVRNFEPIFAAKIENIIFSGEQDNGLQLGVPPKLVFLRDQMKEATTHAKLLSYLNRFWRPGTQFQVHSGKEPPLGESLQSLQRKKLEQSEADIRQYIATHPKVIAVQKIFTAQIQGAIPLENKNKV